MSIKSINPYTGDALEEFEEYSSERIQQALNTAEDTYQDWRKKSFAERANILLKVAKLLNERKQDYAKTMSLEMGKPITEAIAEVEKCAWVCEYYAENAEQMLKDKGIETDAKQKSFVRYQAIGAVLAVMPWNYPFWQYFRFIAPNMMAGNVGILKHASSVSRCALQMEELFLDAGAPEGVSQTLLINSDKVEGVLKSRIIKAATLTGSEPAGRSVASIAGSQIKKTVLELGGSNAFIVLDDAKLDEAVEVGVKARFQNTGQSCIAAKRFLIQESIADEYLQRYVEKIKSLKVGDPLDEGTQIGPLARKDLAEDLESQVKKSLSAGAELIIGGGRNEAVYQPAVVAKTQKGMPVFDEETFGPVAAFCTFESLEDAIALSNHNPFGLGASVFTQDYDKVEIFINELDEGAVFVNGLVKSDPRLPFGGVKHSGYGRELSEDGLKEFLNKKTVHIN